MNAPKQKSWRDVLSVHPAADLFPMMAKDELRALANDIKQNGLKTPCRYYYDPATGRYILIDGRNRLDALELIGDSEASNLQNSIVFEEWPSGDYNILQLVVSLNIHRRHLTVEQKRDLAAKLIKADPGKSDRQIAETVKVSPTTVGSVRAEMEKSGDVSKLDTRADSKGRQQPARKDRRRWNDGGAQTKRNAKRAGLLARPPRDHEDSPEAVARRKHDAFLIAANEARAFAQYDGPISEPIIESALRTAAIWQALADRLQAAAGGTK